VYVQTCLLSAFDLTPSIELFKSLETCCKDMAEWPPQSPVSPGHDVDTEKYAQLLDAVNLLRDVAKYRPTPAGWQLLKPILVERFEEVGGRFRTAEKKYKHTVAGSSALRLTKSEKKLSSPSSAGKDRRNAISSVKKKHSKSANAEPDLYMSVSADISIVSIVTEHEHKKSKLPSSSAAGKSDSDAATTLPVATHQEFAADIVPDLHSLLASGDENVCVEEMPLESNDAHMDAKSTVVTNDDNTEFTNDNDWPVGSNADGITSDNAGVTRSVDADGVVKSDSTAVDDDDAASDGTIVTSDVDITEFQKLSVDEVEEVKQPDQALVCAEDILSTSSIQLMFTSNVDNDECDKHPVDAEGEVKSDAGNRELDKTKDRSTLLSELPLNDSGLTNAVISECDFVNKEAVEEEQVMDEVVDSNAEQSVEVLNPAGNQQMDVDNETAGSVVATATRVTNECDFQPDAVLSSDDNHLATQMAVNKCVTSLADLLSLNRTTDVVDSETRWNIGQDVNTASISAGLMSYASSESEDVLLLDPLTDTETDAAVLPVGSESAGIPSLPSCLESVGPNHSIEGTTVVNVVQPEPILSETSAVCSTTYESPQKMLTETGQGCMGDEEVEPDSMESASLHQSDEQPASEQGRVDEATKPVLVDVSEADSAQMLTMTDDVGSKAYVEGSSAGTTGDNGASTCSETFVSSHAQDAATTSSKAGTVSVADSKGMDIFVPSTIKLSGNAASVVFSPCSVSLHRIRASVASACDKLQRKCSVVLERLSQSQELSLQPQPSTQPCASKDDDAVSIIIISDDDDDDDDDDDSDADNNVQVDSAKNDAAESSSHDIRNIVSRVVTRNDDGNDDVPEKSANNNIPQSPRSNDNAPELSTTMSDENTHMASLLAEPANMVSWHPTDALRDLAAVILNEADASQEQELEEDDDIDLPDISYILDTTADELTDSSDAVGLEPADKATSHPVAETAELYDTTEHVAAVEAAVIVSTPATSTGVSLLPDLPANDNDGKVIVSEEARTISGDLTEAATGGMTDSNIMDVGYVNTNSAEDQKNIDAVGMKYSRSPCLEDTGAARIEYTISPSPDITDNPDVIGTLSSSSLSPLVAESAAETRVDSAAFAVADVDSSALISEKVNSSVSAVEKSEVIGTEYSRSSSSPCIAKPAAEMGSDSAVFASTDVDLSASGSERVNSPVVVSAAEVIGMEHFRSPSPCIAEPAVIAETGSSVITLALTDMKSSFDASESQLWAKEEDREDDTLPASPSEEATTLCNDVSKLATFQRQELQEIANVLADGHNADKFASRDEATEDTCSLIAQPEPTEPLSLYSVTLATSSHELIGENVASKDLNTSSSDAIELATAEAADITMPIPATESLLTKETIAVVPECQVEFMELVGAAVSEGASGSNQVEPLGIDADTDEVTVCDENNTSDVALCDTLPVVSEHSDSVDTLTQSWQLQENTREFTVGENSDRLAEITEDACGLMVQPEVPYAVEEVDLFSTATSTQASSEEQSSTQPSSEGQSEVDYSDDDDGDFSELTTAKGPVDSLALTKSNNQVSNAVAVSSASSHDDDDDHDDKGVISDDDASAQLKVHTTSVSTMLDKLGAICRNVHPQSREARAPKEPDPVVDESALTETNYQMANAVTVSIEPSTAEEPKPMKVEEPVLPESSSYLLNTVLIESFDQSQCREHTTVKEEPDPVIDRSALIETSNQVSNTLTVSSASSRDDDDHNNKAAGRDAAARLSPCYRCPECRQSFRSYTEFITHFRDESARLASEKSSALANGSESGQELTILTEAVATKSHNHRPASAASRSTAAPQGSDGTVASLNAASMSDQIPASLTKLGKPEKKSFSRASESSIVIQDARSQSPKVPVKSHHSLLKSPGKSVKKLFSQGSNSSMARQDALTQSVQEPAKSRQSLPKSSGEPKKQPFFEASGTNLSSQNSVSQSQKLSAKSRRSLSNSSGKPQKNLLSQGSGSNLAILQGQTDVVSMSYEVPAKSRSSLPESAGKPKKKSFSPGRDGIVASQEGQSDALQANQLSAKSCSSLLKSFRLTGRSKKKSFSQDPASLLHQLPSKSCASMPSSSVSDGSVSTVLATQATTSVTPDETSDPITAKFHRRHSMPRFVPTSASTARPRKRKLSLSQKSADITSVPDLVNEQPQSEKKMSSQPVVAKSGRSMAKASSLPWKLSLKSAEQNFDISTGIQQEKQGIETPSEDLAPARKSRRKALKSVSKSTTPVVSKEQQEIDADVVTTGTSRCKSSKSVSQDIAADGSKKSAACPSSDPSIGGNQQQTKQQQRISLRLPPTPRRRSVPKLVSQGGSASRPSSKSQRHSLSGVEISAPDSQAAVKKTPGANTRKRLVSSSSAAEAPATSTHDAKKNKR